MGEKERFYKVKAIDIKIGDIIVYDGQQTEYERVVTKIKNRILYYEDTATKEQYFCSFNDMDDMLKAGTMTIKINLINKRKNNNGLDTCCFCGGKTRKCGGMNPKIDYRVCMVCGK